MPEMGVALLAMAVEAFDGRNRIQYEIRGYQGLYKRLAHDSPKPYFFLNSPLMYTTGSYYY